MNRLAPALALLLAALLLLACKGGGGAGEPAPASTVSSPNLSEEDAPAVQAVANHIRETGLDGRTGSVTDPADCDLAEEADAKGDFCVVVEAGVHAPALAIVFVSSRDREDSWQVHLDLDTTTSEWEVTSVDYID